MVFFIRIDGHRTVSIFVKMRLHELSSNLSDKKWEDALSTVSAAKIRETCKGFWQVLPKERLHQHDYHIHCQVDFQVASTTGCHPGLETESNVACGE